MPATPSATEPCTPHADCRDLTLAIGAALDQLARVVASLDAAQFCSKSCDPAFGASIGRHVRHVLDHISAVEIAAMSARIADYEARARDSRMEHEPGIALAEIARLRDRLDLIAPLEAALPATIMIAITRGQPKATLPSTVGRELSFVLSHTIHHHAIIRIMLCDLGLISSINPEFGLAPGSPDGVPNPCAR